MKSLQKIKRFIFALYIFLTFCNFNESRIFYHTILTLHEFCGKFSGYAVNNFSMMSIHVSIESKHQQK